MKKIYILLTCLILIIIGLLIYILGFTKPKIANNETKKEPTKQVEKEKNDVEEIKVVSSLKKKTYYTVNGNKVTLPCDSNTYASISVDIPKIDSNKPGAEELNSKIANTCGIDTVNKTDFSDVSPKNYTEYIQTYETKTIDDMIIIYINEKIKNCGSSGSSDPITYVYDIKSDKQLSILDVLNKYNISIDTVKQGFDMSEIDEMGNEGIRENFDNNINTLNSDWFNLEYIDENKLEIAYTGGFYHIKSTVKLR